MTEDPEDKKILTAIIGSFQRGILNPIFYGVIAALCLGALAVIMHYIGNYNILRELTTNNKNAAIILCALGLTAFLTLIVSAIILESMKINLSVKSTLRNLANRFTDLCQFDCACPACKNRIFIHTSH